MTRIEAIDWARGQGAAHAGPELDCCEGESDGVAENVYAAAIDNGVSEADIEAWELTAHARIAFYAALEVRPRRCTACDGSGRDGWGDDCPYCDGSGVVTSDGEQQS